jgi:hypothetical protein
MKESGKKAERVEKERIEAGGGVRMGKKRVMFPVSLKREFLPV